MLAECPECFIYDYLTIFQLKKNKTKFVKFATKESPRLLFISLLVNNYLNI